MTDRQKLYACNAVWGIFHTIFRSVAYENFLPLCQLLHCSVDRELQDVSIQEDIQLRHVSQGSYNSVYITSDYTRRSCTNSLYKLLHVDKMHETHILILSNHAFPGFPLFFAFAFIPPPSLIKFSNVVVFIRWVVLSFIELSLATDEKYINFRLRLIISRACIRKRCLFFYK